jgi:hypothetical protein
LPILRLARDKRGIDTVYLLESGTDGRRGGGLRVLYFWTAPSGLRVGVDALDISRQRQLQRAFPDVVFDWPALLASLAASRQQAAAAALSEGWRENGRGGMRVSRGSRGSDEMASASRPMAASGRRPIGTREDAAAREGTAPALAVPPVQTPGEAGASEQVGASGVQEPPARKRRRRVRRASRSDDAPPPSAPPIIDT